jgi:hypothetical protein
MPTLYETTIPVFIRQLQILSTLLNHGVAHAADSSNAVTEQSLVDARLIADMQTLAYQIQRVSDSSKGFAVRVAKIEPVAFEDNEKTFAELQERIAKTIKFLEGVKVCLLPFSSKFCSASLFKGNVWRFEGDGACESDEC